MLLNLPDNDDSAEAVSGEGFPFAVPGFDIQAFIGGGGMGRVYRATRNSDQKEVAIKILNTPWLESHAIRERFRREVELAAAIGDPRTVNVIESGLEQEEHLFYYAMEFIDGVPIDRFVRNNQLAEAQILELTVELCGAVSEAHQIGIIHRDLKPANILVTGNSEVRVLDFGLARFIDFEQKSSSLTVGQIIGTPGYMAPEVTDLSRPAGVQLDVFSLGVILSTLLGAELNPSTGDIKLPTLPRDLGAICSKAIQSTPSDRYRSVDALQEDLESYLKGEPIRARPLTRWSHLKRWAKRHPATLVCASFATLTILALTVGMTVFGIRESQARSELEAQAEVRRKQMVELLLTCDPANLEAIYESLAPHAEELQPLLKEYDSPSWSNPTRQARIDALLSELEPERLNGLKGILLGFKNLHEVHFLAKLLLPYRERLSNEVWESLLHPKGNDKRRLSMAAALSVWDPENSKNWQKISEDIAFRCSQRANQNGLVDDSIDAFQPVKKYLRPHFAIFYQDDLDNPYTAALYAGMQEDDFQAKLEKLLTSDEAFQEGIAFAQKRPLESSAIFQSLLHFQYRWIGGEGYDHYARCVAGNLICGGVNSRAWGRLRLGFRGRPALIEKLPTLGVPEELLVGRLKRSLTKMKADPPPDREVGLAAAIVRILASHPPREQEHISFLKKIRDSLLHQEERSFGKNSAELRESLEKIAY